MLTAQIQAGTFSIPLCVPADPMHMSATLAQMLIDIIIQNTSKSALEFFRRRLINLCGDPRVITDSMRNTLTASSMNSAEKIHFMLWLVIPVFRDLNILTSGFPCKKKNGQPVCFSQMQKECIFQICRIMRVLWCREYDDRLIDKCEAAVDELFNIMYQCQFPKTYCGIYVHYRAHILQVHAQAWPSILAKLLCK